MGPTPKKLIFGKAAQAKLKEGIDKLADAVSVTLGPRGHKFNLPSIWGPSKRASSNSSMTNDRALKDPYVNMGVLMGWDMARKIKDASGDGTTTGIILLRALVKEGMRHVLSGVNPMMIKRGMETALRHVLTAIDTLSAPVEGAEAIKSIATASAFGDKEIGKMIFEVADQIGESGVVVVEEGQGMGTEVKVVEGMQLDCGYASPYFCTNSETMRVEMKETALLIIDGTLSTLQDTLPLLENVAFRMQPLLIIAGDIGGNALSTLVMNKLHGIMQIAAIRASNFGNYRRAILEDIAVLTGATVISKSEAMGLRHANIDMIGKIKELKIQEDATIIVSQTHRRDAIALRLEQIEKEERDATSDEERKKLNERKVKLQSGIAIIRVGAPTKSEMRRKKQIFEKSVNATLIARESGCVPGGGLALLRASQMLSQMAPSSDEKVGSQIMAQACMMPFRQMVKSCGKDGSSSFKKVLGARGSVGFNALTETVEDLSAAKIIDPTKVVKTALKFAVSTAGTILLSDVLITDDFEEAGQSS